MSDHSRIWVIKLGTHVISDESGLNDKVLSGLVYQICKLAQQGIRVILVSSGAVRAGLDAVPHLNQGADEVSRRQVCSAIGQIYLMQAYQRFFSQYQQHCAQVLATKADFRDRRHYLNMQQCLAALLAENVTPIVNENDVVSVTELMFTDNDELAGLISSMVNAEKLVILSNIDHVYHIVNGEKKAISNWSDSEHQFSSTMLNPMNASGSRQALPARSAFGRGGMHTKLKTALRAAAMGTEVWIGNGRRKNNLLELAQGEAIGTCFPPQAGKTAVKRWVASSSGHEKAAIVVNEGAEKVLRDPGRLVSLLPVGVLQAKGEFAKGDILRIENEAGELLGLGKAQYGVEALHNAIGQRQQKPIIHYDYLFIDID